jgi:hypothetical protein
MPTINKKAATQIITIATTCLLFHLDITNSVTIEEEMETKAESLLLYLLAIDPWQIVLVRCLQ